MPRLPQVGDWVRVASRQVLEHLDIPIETHQVGVTGSMLGVLGELVQISYVDVSSYHHQLFRCSQCPGFWFPIEWLSSETELGNKFD
jgi:hypothetical protein